MKKFFQNKGAIFALFCIIIIGGFYTRRDMRDKMKKSSIKSIETNGKIISVDSPKKSQAPTESLTKPAKIFRTPKLEEEKKILAFATFIDEIHKFDKADKKQIQTLLIRGYSQFPKLKELQEKTSGDVHFIPVEVKLTGEFISKIIQISRRNPLFKDQAYTFFSNCSRDNEIPTTIRAICLSHYLRWAKEKGDKVDTSGLPKRVIELSNLTLQLDTDK